MERVSLMPGSIDSKYNTAVRALQDIAEIFSSTVDTVDEMRSIAKDTLTELGEPIPTHYEE